MLYKNTDAQIITTYAGTGRMGYSGDGGPAVQAQMVAPFDLAFDKAGNLYVDDDGNNAIRKIDAVTHIMTTVVGGGNNYDNGALKDAALNHPRGIAFDKNDNLYIADASTYIRKVDFTAQTITTIAGTRGVTNGGSIGLGDGGPALNAYFDGIAGMAIDNSGNLYVADYLNFCVRRIDAQTQVVTTFAGQVSGGSVPTVEMDVSGVLDVAVDKEGNVYIPNHGMIRKVDIATHQITTLAGNQYNGSYSGDGGPAINATLSPIGIWVDGSHNVYVTDWGNQRIRKIDNATGIITTLAGNGTEGYTADCSPAQQSALNWPWAVITNSSGQVFFTELHNYIVREITDAKTNLISGTNTLCLNQSVLLQNEASGGTWASTNGAVATVDNNGMVTGIVTGTTNITYTATTAGCGVTTSMHTIQVKAVDESSALASSQHTCLGTNVLLTGFSGSDVWVSSDSSVAFVNSSGYMNSGKSGSARLKHLVQEQCAVTGIVTVQVYQPQPLFIGNDASFCRNQPLTINAGNTFTAYQWSTGEALSSITVTAPGIYSVAATDVNQCVARDTIVIKNVFDTSAISWPNTSALCKGASLLLSAPADAASVLWQDLSTEKTFTVTQPGVYWVRVTNSHQCVSSDTLLIDREVTPPSGFLPNDTLICSYDNYRLAPVGSFASYQWSTGSSASSITVTDSGVYALQATDGYGCTGTDSIVIGEKTCYNNIYFPNAFTPDGNGRNDVFRPKVYGSLLQFTMTIYNRWGKKVFETEDWQQGWNGYSGFIPQDAGTYIWQATYQLPGGSKKSEKGVFVLIR